MNTDALKPLDPLVAWLPRFFLVILFPFSAIDKIIHWPLALQQASSSFLPGGSVLLVVGMIVEFVCPIAIVLGRYDRFAAFILAGFCAVTAILYHNFWAYPGFWDPKGGPALDHFWEFLKNFGLVGGLMMVMLGARTRPFSAVAQHPFSDADAAP